MISLAKDQMWALGLDSIRITVCSFRFGRPLYRIHRLAGGRHLGVRDPGHPAERRRPIDRLVDLRPRRLMGAALLTLVHITLLSLILVSVVWHFCSPPLLIN